MSHPLALAGQAYVLATVLAGVTALGLAAYVHRQETSVIDTRGFVFYLAGAGVATLLFVGVILAESERAMLQATNLVLSILILSQLGFLHFVLAYTSNLKYARSRPAAVAVAGSLAGVAVVWTDGIHGAFRARVFVYETPVHMIDVTHGPAGAAVLGYLFVLSAVGTALILVHLSRSRTIYQVQGALVAVAAVAPWTGYFLNALEWPDPAVDVTLLFLVVSGGLYTLAISRFGFLDVTGLANRTIVENLDDYAVVADPEGTVVECNRTDGPLVAVEEPIGRPVTEVLAVELPGSDPRERHEREVTVDAGEGRAIYHLRSIPLRADGGRFLGRTITLRDVTDIRARERELERKNEFLDEFASVVSHDVATPLGVIENKARLIEATGDPDHAADIYEATEQVHSMIDELRTLARQGERVGETAPVDLETVTREAWRTVESPGATLSVTDSRTVEANRDLLVQLLANLLDNAVEHGSTSPDSQTRQDAVERGTGSPESDRAGSATAGAPRTDGDPDRVTVEVGTLPGGFYVADDGPGIPEDRRESVFERGVSTDEDSTGLGLAIVRRIADGHGWAVAVTEGEAGGARFEIRTGA